MKKLKQSEVDKLFKRYAEYGDIKDAIKIYEWLFDCKWKPKSVVKK